MNPNDLFLRSHTRSQTEAALAAAQAAAAAAAAAQQQQQQQQAAASGAAQPQMNGQAQQQQGPPGRSYKEVEQERKDLELSQLLDMMDDYKPIIPDEVTDYYLQRSGFDTNDVRVKRLLSLAAQRFISSISADAFQYARARTAAGPGGRVNAANQAAAAAAGGTGAAGKDGAKKGRQRTVLTMEDLSAALKEYGVDASRAPYYL